MPVFCLYCHVSFCAQKERFMAHGLCKVLKLGMEVQSQYQMCGKSLYYRQILRCVRTLHIISDVWEALAPF